MQHARNAGAAWRRATTHALAMTLLALAACQIHVGGPPQAPFADALERVQASRARVVDQDFGTPREYELTEPMATSGPTLPRGTRLRFEGTRVASIKSPAPLAVEGHTFPGGTTVFFAYDKLRGATLGANDTFGPNTFGEGDQLEYFEAGMPKFVTLSKERSVGGKAYREGQRLYLNLVGEVLSQSSPEERAQGEARRQRKRDACSVVCGRDIDKPRCVDRCMD